MNKSTILSFQNVLRSDSNLNTELVTHYICQYYIQTISNVYLYLVIFLAFEMVNIKVFFIYYS